MNTEDLFHAALARLADFLRTCDASLTPSRSNLGRYESDAAAMSLVILAASNAWAVHDLGITSPIRYPACAACARCAFEVGAVAAWLLVPDDPFQREGRWLGWFKANERFYTTLSNDLSPVSPELAEAMRQTAIHHSNWRRTLEAKLPRGEVTEKPAMPIILKELGFLQLYPAYREISQVVHGEPQATSLVHKVEYTAKDSSSTDAIFEAVGQRHFWGSFASESDWALAIRMASWSLMISLPKLLSRIKAFDCDSDPLFQQQAALHQALERLTTTADGSRPRSWPSGHSNSK